MGAIRNHLLHSPPLLTRKERASHTSMATYKMIHQMTYAQMIQNSRYLYIKVQYSCRMKTISCVLYMREVQN